MKPAYTNRRNLLRLLALMPLSLSGLLTGMDIRKHPYKQKNKPLPHRISLNAYSFNASLTNGAMSLDELLEYCAIMGFDAVDLTAYYFPGYPEVPTDEYLYHIKSKAFRLGLDISGTGVRNDFTNPDKEKRKEHILLVKKWIEAASKLGAPVIRIFSGTQNPPGYSREQVVAWMVSDIKECVEHGKKNGVMVGLQNHYDYIKTPAETMQLISLVDSSWFGLILDIGSYRSEAPYNEVKEMAPYAVSWQIKEKMFIGKKEINTDLDKIIKIVRDSGYRGYLPIETLGPGEPKTKVAYFLGKVRKAMR